MPLKRVITLKEALAINIGAIIGAGIFTISGLAAGIAGPSVILAILLGGLVSILTGLSFAELSYSTPKEGGNYEYARDYIGKYAGFIAGWVFIASAVVGGAAVAISFGSYFSSLFGANLNVDAVAAVMIAVLGIVNYFGVKHSARLSLSLTVIKILILALFIIVGVFFIKPGNYSPFLPTGFGGLITASAFVFFAYTGFARVTTIGEEVKDPKRTIPRAIIYSILISGIIYALVVFVLIGIIPYGNLAASQSPLQLAIGYATHNPLLVEIISLGALFATLNVDLSMILGVSRVAFAMSRNSDMPAFMARLNRYGAPDIAIVASTALMVIIIVAISFREIVSLINAAALLSYSLANIAAVRLALSGDPKRHMFKSRYFAIVPIAGVLSTLGLLGFLTSASLIILVVLIALITIYYLLAVRPRKGEHRGARTAPTM
ncbi:MAG: amino acid permease [Candidatus Micrarchaeota archaeon]|nr:amino acid permease [Candidatus Micrarchaeota archaeon]